MNQYYFFHNQTKELILLTVMFESFRKIFGLSFQGKINQLFIQENL
jgi:hypothetical protein